MQEINNHVAALAGEIHDFLAANGQKIKSLDSDGQVTADYEEAESFTSGKPGYTIHIDRETSTVRFVPTKDVRPKLAERIAKYLKMLAVEKYNFLFDWSAMDKKIEPKKGDNNVEENTMAEVMEGFGAMTGSKRTSYQALEDNVKIVVKHKKPVNEESRGARSRDIHSIYIQRGDEKFKMQENNLRAARAMARHIHMGGEMFDDVGRSITEMAQEQRKLQRFVKYVNKAGIVNEENAEIVEMANQNVSNIKDTFEKLSSIKSYANAVESLNDMSSVEVLEDDLDLEAKFTEKKFDTSVEEAVESIKRSAARTRKYQAHIENAIANEDYSNLKNALNENDMEFSSPYARLGFQVSQMANQTQDRTLRNHLTGISKRIASGGTLNQFEYGTVKSCLMSASQPRVKESAVSVVKESVEAQYEAFLNKFDIF